MHHLQNHQIILPIILMYLDWLLNNHIQILIHHIQINVNYIYLIYLINFMVKYYIKEHNLYH